MHVVSVLLCEATQDHFTQFYSQVQSDTAMLNTLFIHKIQKLYKQILLRTILQKRSHILLQA